MKKRGLKNDIKTGLLGITMSFLLWNCENELVGTLEEPQSHIETVSVEEAVDFFRIENLSKTTKTDKKDYVTLDLSHISQEDIINSDALLTVIPVNTIYKNYYSRILLLKIDNEIQSLVFSMYASGTANPYFSGEILITDLQGRFLNGYRVENGKFISQFRKKTGSKSEAAKTGNVVCPEHGECNGETDCILCLQELEEVEVVGETGSSGEGIEVYPGLNDFPGIEEGGDSGPDTGMSWDYGPGEGMDPKEENACPEGYVKDNTGMCVEEEKIIDELTGKEKCIHDLLNETGNSYIKDILSKFDGNSEFDIKIESKDTVINKGNEVNGRTNKPFNSDLITIEISTSKAIGRPVLDVARTILHEYIHADMFRKLYTKYPTDGDLDFKQTYEAFKGLNFSATPQHETMAALYVGEMTKALKNFHENALTEDYNYLTDNGNNSLPDSFYEALAWLGLKEHNVQAYIDLSDEEKAALENSLTIYYPSTTKDCSNN